MIDLKMGLQPPRNAWRQAFHEEIVLHSSHLGGVCVWGRRGEGRGGRGGEGMERRGDEWNGAWRRRKRNHETGSGYAPSFWLGFYKCLHDTSLTPETP